MFANKDQLTNYLVQGHLHLSKKDYGFFNNIKTIVNDNKPITTNQDKLFNKLLVKYQRQLNKLDFNCNDLAALPWQVELIESKQDYLNAHVVVDNDVINIRAPFNSKFIQLFRNIPLNEFIWDKVKRIYSAPLTTYQLRIAIDTVSKCYETVVYCDNVKNILKQVEEYINIKYWQPTLVKINNNLYILATNHSLNEAIKDIELKEDTKTFYLLSQYGITVHDDLLTDDCKKFSAKYITQIDAENLQNFSDYLQQLNVKTVFTSRDIIYNKELSNDLKLSLLEKGIACRLAKEADNIADGVLLKTIVGYSMPFDDKKYNKIVHFTNSRPIHIK
jgi:hypothetical protein